MKQEDIHISFDLETLSLESNAAIVQIGAVHVGSSEEFNSYISPQSAEYLGGHVDVGTINWWAKQDPQIRNTVFGGTTYIRQALAEFYEWCLSLADGDINRVYLWSKGADFDCVVLKNNYELFMEYPFNFRNHRCVRTAMHLKPLENPTPNQGAHDALEDAKYQAQFIKHALAL